MVTRTTEIPPWWDAANEVLEAAVERDDDRAIELLGALAQTYWAVMPEIMLAWIDALFYAQGITTDEYGQKRFHLHTQNIETGTLDDANPADPVNWVGALCQARVTDDRHAYYDLLRSLQPSTHGTYIWCLVQTVGITVGNALSGALQQQRAHIHGEGCTGEH